MDDLKERLRIMRNSTAKWYNVNVPTGVDQPFLGRAANRIAIIIGPVVSGAVTLQSAPGGTALTGFKISTTTQPISLNIFDHGAAVAGPLFASNSGAAADVGVIEVFGPP